MRTVTIVDYGSGNLQSVRRRLSALGANVLISSDPHEVATAERLVLPGVGHFGKAMETLQQNGLDDALSEAVLSRGTPILGICLGMQLMAASSTEGDAHGLGWLKGHVVRFNVADRLRYKVPHIGWNQVRRTKASALIAGIPDLAEFYFVHSYHYVPEDGAEELLVADYSYPFSCGIEQGNIFGVQFHPEKSHEVGAKLLGNFVRL